MAISFKALTLIFAKIGVLSFGGPAGQIALMLTDFFQGLFAYIAVAAVLIFCFIAVDWSAIGEVAQTAEAGKSIVNPFDTGGHKTFAWWYFLIMIVMYAIGTGSWQGTAGYNSAARSPHEQRMAKVMGMWRIISTDTLMLFGAVVIYAVMHHAKFAAAADSARAILDSIDSKSIRSLMMVPVGMAQILPKGLRGMLAAMVLAACISTLDTYLHSWGTMFIQDVVMPWKKKPFSPKRHMLLLRIAIVGVAVWAFIFSMLFNLDEALALFFAITGAIFMGGSGAAIVGGLYWKRGRTAGAWGGMIVGSTLAVGSILVRQLWPNYIVPELKLWSQLFFSSTQYLKDHAAEFPINSFYLSIITTVCAIGTYVVLSLVKRETFNLNRMLHRGRYASSRDRKDTERSTGEVKEGWIAWALRKLGLTADFTLADKFIFGATIFWSVGWGVVFLGGTAYYLTKGFADSVWLEFWKIKIWIMFGLVLVVAAVFVIGGMIDLKSLVRSLRTMRRDDRDDGMVIDGANRDEVSIEEEALAEGEAVSDD